MQIVALLVTLWVIAIVVLQDGYREKFFIWTVAVPIGVVVGVVVILAPIVVLYDIWFA